MLLRATRREFSWHGLWTLGVTDGTLRAVVELPSGTVTFLFTDVEDSTRLWDEFPAAMQPALARHDEILRTAVLDHGGGVVKTLGDGIHAVFGTARDAVEAALAAQRTLVAEGWAGGAVVRV